MYLQKFGQAKQYTLHDPCTQCTRPDYGSTASVHASWLLLLVLMPTLPPMVQCIPPARHEDAMCSGFCWHQSSVRTVFVLPSALGLMASSMALPMPARCL